MDLSLGGGQGKERRPPVVVRISTKEYLRDLPRPSEPLLPLLWAVLTTLTPTLSFLGFWVVYHSAIVGTSALRRDNNNKLKQQTTSNFVKENTLGIPEEILRVHLFKSYGQPPVDTEHDKPSSLTHIDAEPLLKKTLPR